MKFLTALVVIATFALSVQAASLTPEQKEKIKGFINECIESTGVDKALVKNSREKGEFADDTKLENYYFCMSKKLNFMNDDGTFNPDVVKSKIPATVDQEKAKALVDRCVQVHGNRKEQTALLAYKCYKEQPELTFT